MTGNYCTCVLISGESAHFLIGLVPSTIKALSGTFPCNAPLQPILTTVPGLVLLKVFKIQSIVLM